MLEFTERTVTPSSVSGGLFDIAISPDGEYFAPAPLTGVTWTPRVRSGDDWIAGAASGWGPMASYGVSFTADSQYLYQAYNAVSVYRGVRSGNDFVLDASWAISVGATIRSIAVNANNTLVAVGINNSVTVYSVATKAAVFSYNLGSLCEEVSFSPDGLNLVATARSHGPFFFSVSGTTVAYVTSGFIGYGNWYASWHKDSDHVAFCQYTAGGNVSIFKRTGGTFARIAAPFSDGGVAAQILMMSYLGGTCSDYLIMGAYGSAQTKIYKREGDAYTLFTDHNFAQLAGVEGMRSARTANRLVLYNTSGGLMRAFDYDAPQASNDAEAAFTGYLGETAAEVDFGLGVFSDVTGYLGQTSALIEEILPITAEVGFTGYLGQTSAEVEFETIDVGASFSGYLGETAAEVEFAPHIGVTSTMSGLRGVSSAEVWFYLSVGGETGGRLGVMSAALEVGLPPEPIALTVSMSGYLGRVAAQAYTGDAPVASYDYTDDLAFATEIITEFGSPYTLIRKNEGTDPANPLGPSLVADTTASAFGVSLEVIGNEFGRYVNLKELQAKHDAVYLFPGKVGFDYTNYHLVRDASAVTWKIGDIMTFKPGNMALLYFIGVTR